MFERIKRLYDSGDLSVEGIKKAVEKGLINSDQYEQITGKKYKP